MSNFLGRTFGRILGARDFSSAVSCFGCTVIARNEKTSHTQVSSGVTLRLCMKQDVLFGEEILHENGLRL